MTTITIKLHNNNNKHNFILMAVLHVKNCDTCQDSRSAAESRAHIPSWRITFNTLLHLFNTHASRAIFDVRVPYLTITHEQMDRFCAVMS